MESTILFKNNEEGSAIILAVLILAVLTILGVSSINTSTVELQIVRNERIYQQNFNIAESAAMHSIKRIGNMDGQEDYNDLMPSTTSLVWLNVPDPTDPDFWDDTDNWDYDDTGGDNAEESADGTYKYAADYKGKQGGSSLKQGALSVNLYAVYGLAEKNNGKTLIQLGCKKTIVNP